jgi:hypothetical protein
MNSSIAGETLKFISHAPMPLVFSLQAWCFWDQDLNLSCPPMLKLICLTDDVGLILVMFMQPGISRKEQYLCVELVCLLPFVALKLSIFWFLQEAILL